MWVRILFHKPPGPSRVFGGPPRPAGTRFSPVENGFQPQARTRPLPRLRHASPGKRQPVAVSFAPACALAPRLSPLEFVRRNTVAREVIRACPAPPLPGPGSESRLGPRVGGAFERRTGYGKTDRLACAGPGPESGVQWTPDSASHPPFDPRSVLQAFSSHPMTFNSGPIPKESAVHGTSTRARWWTGRADFSHENRAGCAAATTFFWEKTTAQGTPILNREHLRLIC